MKTNDIERLNSIILGLKVQKTRIQNNPKMILIDNVPITSTHDADFYTIILRRVYRKIDKLAKELPEINKIHSENSEFFEKIRIRDHFDKMESSNWEDVEKIGESNVDHLKTFQNAIFPAIAKVIILPMVIENKIISGPYEWDLEIDHTKLLKITNDVIAILKKTPPPPSEIDWKHS